MHRILRPAAIALVLVLGSAAHAEGVGEPAYIGGRFDLRGWTTLSQSGERRAIAGNVIFDQRGADYTATYQLGTRITTDDGPRRASVVGRGSGHITGNVIEGSAETQLIFSSAPGIDVTVPYVPKRFGPIITQLVQGTVDESGELELRIEYRPVEGGPPEASSTVLRGRRVAPE